MTRLATASILALLLGGCGGAATSSEESARRTGDISLTNATMEDVKKQTLASRDKNSIQPGEWENKVEVVGAGTAPLVRTSCVTPEKAKAVNFDALTKVAKECHYPKYVVSGGRIDAQVECIDLQDNKISIAMEGTQSKTAFDITMKQKITPAAGGTPVDQTARVSGRRLGECKG
ncbi:MAG: DUF3617 domain-containing protein [Pseudomonadota bacterium]